MQVVIRNPSLMNLCTVRNIWSAVLLLSSALVGLGAEVVCEGSYPQHLQGVCLDAQGNIYWSFTTALVKTDGQGKKLKEIEVPTHHGDLCIAEGRIYVAVNHGPFNDPAGKADSWVYVYDGDLEFLSKHATPQIIYGAGGMDYREGKFYVIGGLPGDLQQNYVYEYDRELSFVKQHVIESGQTLLGIQTAAWAKGHWWFGCYGTPRVMLKTDKDFNLLGKYEFDCAYGVAASPDGGIFVARDWRAEGRHHGAVDLASADPVKGLAKAGSTK